MPHYRRYAKGKPLEETLEEAFLLLDTSPVLAELMDEAKQAHLKQQYRRYFTEREKAP